MGSKLLGKDTATARCSQIPDCSPSKPSSALNVGTLKISDGRHRLPKADLSFVISGAFSFRSHHALRNEPR